jgi:altronate hydrolase
VKSSIIKIQNQDNVIVALQNLAAGTTLAWEGEKYTLPYPIEAKHKFVTQDLAVGDAIIMYGVLVGKAVQPIQKGEVITTFNVKHQAEEYSSQRKQPYAWQKPEVKKWENRTFKGFHRSDGQVGTANYWLVVPLVFCENRNVLKLKEAFEKALGYGIPDGYQNQVRNLVEYYQQGDFEKIKNLQLTDNEVFIPLENRIFKNIDGIKFLTHEGGCGQVNEDSDVLSELFAAYAHHANVAGITVLSLGCQKSQFTDLQAAIYQRNPSFDKPLLFFEQQQYGTEYKMLSAAIQATFAGLIEANQITRQPAPLSKLKIGLKCGGSDGFSGISANPILGHLSDILVALGGTTLLAEFPELCGVEQNLIDRCIDLEKAQKFERLMRDYAQKAEAVGSGFDMNPSKGNIKDGLITDAIKSAGAAKKGGTAPIANVLNYTELATESGLQLVCTPGNDVLATTGKAAAGATIILFTTGLGTPTGNPVCPVVKVSTNSQLAQKMPDIIDFDCGEIITGEKSIEQTAEELLEYVIGLASGEYQTKAQMLGQDDFIPWQRGVNL